MIHEKAMVAAARSPTPGRHSTPFEAVLTGMPEARIHWSLARAPRMARWERLYHERVAWLFGRGLYWRRFADVRENRANSCFLASAWRQDRARALGRVESAGGARERNKQEWRM